MECRLLNRPSREPLKDWRRRGDSHSECKPPPWRRPGTNVSLGWHKPPGRAAEHRGKLDPDIGVWCDSVRNRQSEKAGAVKSLQDYEGGMHSCIVVTQIVCDGLLLSLTSAG